MTVTSSSDQEASFDAAQRDLEIFKADVKLVAWACESLWHDKFRLQAPDSNEFMSLLPIAILRMVSARAELLGQSDNRQGMS